MARKTNVVIVPTSKTAKKSNTLSGVTFTRSELTAKAAQYQLIRDCLEGETAIKGLTAIATSSVGTSAAQRNGGGTAVVIDASRAKQYLPMPNAADTSTQNQERYVSYVQRAVYVNFTDRTLGGMAGQVFLIDPVVTLPKSLEFILKDADGQGLSLTQLSKRSVRQTASFGRSGILIDYPPTNGPTSIAQLESGEIRPIFTVYEPWNIPNWRTKKRGVKTVLSLIVLKETIDGIAEDGFGVSTVDQYRVLRLNDKDEYTIEIHTAGSEPVKYTPLDSKRKPFDTIPFTFIGSENNDEQVDKPPMYDIASLNVAHYRNSADYEESCYQCGQPTPYVIGLTEQWWKDVLKERIPLGSRAGLPLPENCTVGFLEVKSNLLPKEAMEMKEQQMVSIGAKLIVNNGTVKTATEKISDVSSEQSVLTTVANNVSAAYEFALRFAARFIGAEEDTIKFMLNTSFELNKMTLDDASKLVAIWQKGAMPFEEMREGLRRGGLATMTDDEAKKKIKEEIDAGMVPGPVADPTTPNSEPGKANVRSDPAAHAIEPSTRNMQ